MTINSINIARDRVLSDVAAGTVTVNTVQIALFIVESSNLGDSIDDRVIQLVSGAQLDKLDDVTFLARTMQRRHARRESDDS